MSRPANQPTAVPQRRYPTRAPRHRGRQRPTLQVLAIATGLALATANAGHEAVDARLHPVWGPALTAEAQAVEADAPARAAAARAVTRVTRGVSGWAQLRPSVAWRSHAPDAATALSASVGVAWRDDALARANTELDRHRGDVAAHERALRAVRATTGAWIALRRAHLALELADGQLPTRRQALARAEAGLLAGSVSRNQRDVAALELERAEAAVARAALDLDAAQHEAARRGIDVPAAAAQHQALLHPDPLEGWRLPPPPEHLPHETLLRRALERDVAVARLERRGAWAVLDDVRVEASWSDSGTRLRAGAGLDEGRPSAWADLGLTGGRDAWSLGLSARLRVDDTWEAERQHAERSLQQAEAALAEAVAEAPWLAAQARRSLAEAEADVAFAERALALGRTALRELGTELAAARGAARDAERRGDAAAAEEAGARVGRFEDAYRRAELGHQRERDAFLRAWERYLREAERLSAGVGWPFAVTTGGDVGE